jgi:hypothetical protein
VSSLLNPIGPEPPTVYWIRRVAIVVIVIVVIVALWWGVSALRGGSASDDGAATPSDSASSSVEASDSASPEETASADASDSGEVVECEDSAIEVVATTDSSTYPVGSTPKLTLSITNIGDVACTRDVGPKANELEITSGGYHVWSSDDCNASSKSKVSVLQPDETVASSITWNGRLSQKGCPTEEGDKAKAGRYDLVGRNGKVTSESTPFALTSS